MANGAVPVFPSADATESSLPVSAHLSPADSSIGVLKRKSIMPPCGGASRRKRQRPAALDKSASEVAAVQEADDEEG